MLVRGPSIDDAGSTTARRADRARDDVRLLGDSVGRRAALKVATAVGLAGFASERFVGHPTANDAQCP